MKSIREYINILESIEQGLKESSADKTAAGITAAFSDFGSGIADAAIIKAAVYALQGRYEEADNWIYQSIKTATPEVQDKIKQQLRKMKLKDPYVDPNKDPEIQEYLRDKFVPWLKNTVAQNLK